MLRRVCVSLPGAVAVQGSGSKLERSWLIISYEPPSRTAKDGLLHLSVEADAELAARKAAAGPGGAQDCTVDAIIGIVRFLGGKSYHLCCLRCSGAEAAVMRACSAVRGCCDTVGAGCQGSRRVVLPPHREDEVSAFWERR